MAPSDNTSSTTSSIDEHLSDDDRLQKIFGKNLFEDPNTQQDNSENIAPLLTKNQNQGKKEFDKKRVRSFFIMVAKAAMRHQARMNAHHEFHDQVDKLKNTVQSVIKQPPKTRKVAIDAEIDDLKRKVSYMIEIERGMAAAPSSPEHQKFQQRLQELERKISYLIEHKEAREERFNKLEEKINSQNTSTNKNQYSNNIQDKNSKQPSEEHNAAVDELIQRLLILQKNHLKIKIQARSLKQGSNERKKVEAELDDIKRKIDLTKRAIASLRDE